MAYVIPTAPDLINRYPAFAAVAPATIDLYISEAARDGVDTSWREQTYAPAILALAAHNMALLGIGAHGDVADFKRQGINRIRSGAFDASFSEGAVQRANGGALDATPYGQQYKLMLRREKGGPRIVGRGPTAGDWGHVYEQNNGDYAPWAY